MKKGKNKFFIFLKVIRKRVKLSTLLMLIITFSSSTFAWFIYATKVDSGITAHVKAWNVSFEVGDEEIEENMSFDISEIYPGMPSYNDSVEVKNKGETTAEISYEIISYTMYGVKYEIDETSSITSEDLKQSLLNDYPFKIAISLSSPLVAPNSNEYFSLTVTWPFDSGDDEADTEWGTRAYNYHNAHPDSPSISIELKVSAVQKNS